MVMKGRDGQKTERSSGNGLVVSEFPGQQTQPRLPLHQGNDGLALVVPNYDNQLPIPEPGVALHGRGPHLDSDAIAKMLSATVGPIRLAA